MASGAWLFGLAVTACTFTHGGTRDQTTADAPGAVGCDASSATCSPRVCVDATHSGSCDGSGHVTMDRACPPGSGCSGGYCQPPGGAAPCTTDSQCDVGDVCDLYVQGGSLVGFCTAPLGMDGIYNGCDQNSHCKTGLCADTGECFSACTGACPSGPDAIVCTPLHVTVEGVVSTGVSTCFGTD